MSVVQTTSKSTGVSVSTRAGLILTDSSLLAAGAAAIFTVTYSDCSADDVPVVAVRSGGTAGAYLVGVCGVRAGEFDVLIHNRTGGGLSEAIQLNYLVEKGASA
jgi:hypothetical protein